jgi:DNA primase
MDPKEEIKNRVNIAELIGGYIQIKPGGPASFKALCPFHAEKTPSFHISADKGIWRCFGCNEGGDCFAFVMKMEGMDFPEALRFLGEKVGVEVKRFDSAEVNERTRLIAINELAAKLYKKLLADHPSAEAARAYVKERMLTPDIMEKFSIGFAPDTWDTASTFLAARGYGEGDLERSGLSMRRRQGRGVIDRFRNRLMIPLRDHHGNTVGFTGRVLPSATPDQGPKYMNTPETPIYHKGKLLFGLDLAKQAIKRAGFAVIVEGNLDVVASHKADVENVVASSGTALTEDQIALLKRFTSTLAFCFDADAAGFEAARKGIALARAAGCDVRAIVLPAEAGKDPDYAVRKDPELWRRAVTTSVPIMQYLIARATAGKDMNTVDAKRAVAAVLLPELKALTEVIEREHWLQTVADILRTDANELRKSIGTQALGGQGVRPKIANSARPETLVPSSQLSASPATKEDKAALLLVGIAAQSKEMAKRVSGALGQVELPSPWDRLYKELMDAYDLPQTDASGMTAFHYVRSRLEADPAAESLNSMLDRSMLEGESLLAALSGKELPQRLTELVRIGTAAGRARRRQALEADIRRAERAGDRAIVERLIRELEALR